MPPPSDNAPDAASYGQSRLTDKELDDIWHGQIIYGHLRKRGRPVKKPHYGIILNTNDEIKKIRSGTKAPVYTVICISSRSDSSFLLDPPSRTALTGKIQGEWQTDVEEKAILDKGPRLSAIEMIPIHELIRRVEEAKKKSTRK